MDINKDTNAIAVHGREALNLPYSRWSNGGGNGGGGRVQADISLSTIFIEIPAAGIRAQLVADDADAKGLRIYLTREQVETLPTTASAFVIIDETVPEVPEVEWEGHIYRRGYIGEPTPPQAPLP